MLNTINQYVQTNYSSMPSKIFGGMSAIASLEFAVKTILSLKELTCSGSTGKVRSFLKSRATYEATSAVVYGACAFKVFPGSHVIGSTLFTITSLAQLYIDPLKVNGQAVGENYHPDDDELHYPSNYLKSFVYHLNRGAVLFGIWA